MVKYFTFTSLIVIFLGVLILSLLNTHLARRMQQKKSEEYARLLIENLGHQVFTQFILPVVLKYGKTQLSNKKQFKRMDRVVKSTLHSFKVSNVNIYDMNNTISYSFDNSLVGKEGLGGKGYQDAISGKSTSSLIQRGNWIEVFLGFSKNSQLITFAPLLAERTLFKTSAPVLGVVEITQDLTKDYQAIFDFQIRVVMACTVVMGSLFLILLFVVKKGESIIEKRALERLKLKEKLSRAERLSALGEMVAGISHEIRNPLGIIRSSSELLKKKLTGCDLSNSIPDIIIEESIRLNNIITDFLNFAKPRDPVLQPCRIENVLEKNINFLEPQIEQEAYKVDLDYEDNLPEIMADPDMLYQAFLNIIINAMQAMPGGGLIDVKIRTNKHSIMTIIEDEGNGVAENVLEKIWDPFFTTKEMGTGLGLGIVKNIIEAHGGTIEIAGRQPKGVSVIVALPVQQEI